MRQCSFVYTVKYLKSQNLSTEVSLWYVGDDPVG